MLKDTVPSHVLSQHVSDDIERILRDGLPSGEPNANGWQTLRRALARMEDTGPDEIRPLARTILRMFNVDANAYLTVNDQDRLNLSGAVKVEPVLQMFLFTAEGRTGLTYETILHEASHLALAARFRSLTAKIAHSEQEAEQRRSHSVLAIARFARLWREFCVASKNDRFENRELSTSVTEARSSPDEFFARSLTDPVFQRYLASKPYHGDTLWSRFTGWVRTNLFGNTPDDAAPSWLDAALSASQEVIDLVASNPIRRETPPPPALTRSDNTYSSDLAGAMHSNSRPQEASEEFKRWFGASKLTDPATGDPVVLYHGTVSDFTTFTPSEGGAFGPGIYLADTADEAARWARGAASGHNIMPVYARIENPYFWTSDDSHRHPNIVNAEARASGHDGIIRLWADGTREVAVFDPTQVKSSITNNGHFDPLDPNVMHRMSRIQEQSDEFKKWFSGSSIVENGQPRIVYHGTLEEFDAFQLQSRKPEIGFHFGTQAQANHFAKKTGGRVMPFYLNIKNPLRLDDCFGKGYVATGNIAVQLQSLGMLTREETDKIMALRPLRLATAALRDCIEQAGYDGIVYENRYEGRRLLRDGEDPQITVVPNEYHGKGADPRAVFVAKWRGADYHFAWGTTEEEAYSAALKRLRTEHLIEEDSYIAFRPEQIKSALANRGTFDPTSPNVLHAVSRVQESSDEFKYWFNNSQIVDEQKKPRVMYHGTKSDFSAFDAGADRPNKGKRTTTNMGIFLTCSSQFASGYANDEGGNVMPVYVCAENVFDWRNPSHIGDALEAYERHFKEPMPEVMVGPLRERGWWASIEGKVATMLHREYGYDGIWMTEQEHENLLVFHPTQIKSAIGNNGQFDPDEHNILRSRFPTGQTPDYTQAPAAADAESDDAASPVRPRLRKP